MGSGNTYQRCGTGAMKIPRLYLYPGLAITITSQSDRLPVHLSDSAAPVVTAGRVPPTTDEALSAQSKSTPKAWLILLAALSSLQIRQSAGGYVSTSWNLVRYAVYPGRKSRALSVPQSQEDVRKGHYSLKTARWMERSGSRSSESSRGIGNECLILFSTEGWPESI